MRMTSAASSRACNYPPHVFCFSCHFPFLVNFDTMSQERGRRTAGDRGGERGGPTEYETWPWTMGLSVWCPRSGPWQRANQIC